MGKKKRKVFKSWCYYCEREFDDEKILIQHQKAKHFKCYACHKKLSTAGGMVVHVLQVHKESITKVPNAKPERESVDIEIYGMQGIPPHILAAHNGDDGYEDDDRPPKYPKMDPYGANAYGMVSNPYSSMPPYPAQPPPSIMPPPPPHASQGWYSMPMQPPGVAPRPPQAAAPQPLFPIQSQSQPSQPLFPISTTTTPPVYASSQPQAVSSTPSLSPGSLSVPTPEASAPASSVYVPGADVGESYLAPPPPPPPVAAAKPPGPSATNEVYLVWDDESMSMEERRFALPQYQVLDETLQMNSVDAAIDKRILEGRLAGRMAFKV